MDDAVKRYREAIGRLADGWISSGLPSRQTVDQEADRLLGLRGQLGLQGLWTSPPIMVTATLDDGLGQGLAVIEKYAAVLGLRLVSLGLMQTPERIVAACHRHQADFLGLTVLQFDTEADLIAIAGELPPKTRIVAGGPVFAADPEFAERTGTHYAARNVAYYLRFMLNAA